MEYIYCKGKGQMRMFVTAVHFHSIRQLAMSNGAKMQGPLWDATPETLRKFHVTTPSSIFNELEKRQLLTTTNFLSWTVTFSPY
jgi:hypothetical protein